MQTIPDQIAQARVAFAEAPAERARLGPISGLLWMFSALVGMLDLFLPGSDHAAPPIVLAVGLLIFLYGLGSVTGWIPWEKATMDQLAIGMMLTIPVAGAAIYLTGGSLSYIEPLLVCALLYAAFFFPERWAWPLSIELIVVAGAPLIYDSDAIDNAFLPRYLGLAVGFLAATWVMVGLKKRLGPAEGCPREFSKRGPPTRGCDRRF